MRIALYHNLISGGAKRTLTEAARRLATRHHLDIYTLSSADHDFSDLRPYAVNHHVFPFRPLPLLRSPWGRLNQIIRIADLIRLDRLNRRIARHIDRNGYDAVVAHPCQFEKCPSLLRYLRRTPSIYYCHEPLRLLYEPMPARPYDDNASSRRRFLNQLDPLPILYRRVLGRNDQRNTRSADRVLVNSKFTAEAVSHIYRIPAQVSYHGVDVEQFKPLPVEKRHIVLSVGSLTPLKGFDFLVQAMAQYPATQRPTLVFASNFQNPPERAYLENLARNLGIAIELLGNVSDQDLVRLYNQAKVVAYAPVREPFGLVPLEAMACATPVVAIREGGIPETVIEGQTGFLVGRDPASFARAIQRLVDDPFLARRYGDSGRQHVLNCWTWDQAVERVEGSLKQVIASQRLPSARTSSEVIPEQPLT